MVEAVRAPLPVSGYVVEMLGDIGAPTLQQDVAHLTQRLATLTGAQPAFLRLPGVVASPAIREAMLASDPHAREALRLLDDLDLALLGIGPCEVVGPLQPGDNYFTQEQFDEAARAGAVARSACGSSTRTAARPHRVGRPGGGGDARPDPRRPHPLGGVGRQGQVPRSCAPRSSAVGSTTSSPTRPRAGHLLEVQAVGPRRSAVSARNRSRAPAAARAACRDGTPSFCSTAETWWSTVRTETTSRAAISALVRPSASRRRISTWRPVSPAGLRRVVGLRPRGSRSTPERPQPAAHQGGGGRGAEVVQHGERLERRLRPHRTRRAPAPARKGHRCRPTGRRPPPVAAQARRERLGAAGERLAVLTEPLQVAQQLAALPRPARPLGAGQQRGAARASSGCPVSHARSTSATATGTSTGRFSARSACSRAAASSASASSRPRRTASRARWGACAGRETGVLTAADDLAQPLLGDRQSPRIACSPSR